MVAAKEVNKGACIKHNNEILKVKRKEVVAVGTHSHTKLKFFLRPILSGHGEKEILFAHEDNIETLNIIKKRAQLISLDGKNANIMDLESYETFDATVSDDLTDELVEGGETSFINVEGNVFLINKK